MVPDRDLLLSDPPTALPISLVTLVLNNNGSYPFRKRLYIKKPFTPCFKQEKISEFSSTLLLVFVLNFTFLRIPLLALHELLTFFAFLVLHKLRVLRVLLVLLVIRVFRELRISTVLLLTCIVSLI